MNWLILKMNIPQKKKKLQSKTGFKNEIIHSLIYL